jgi:type VI secretion system protein VasG
MSGFRPQKRGLSQAHQQTPVSRNLHLRVSAVNLILRGDTMKVNLKALIGRLNDTCRSALEGAAGLCLSRTNYDVEIEHLLLKLMEVADTDLARVLRQYEIDSSHLSKDITRALDRLKTGNSRTPALSPRIPSWLRMRGCSHRWISALQDRSGHLMLALPGE